MNDEMRRDLEQNIERITGSEVFLSLYSDRMADFLSDPFPAIQLAIAILLDKPIVVAVLPGRTPPAKLIAIADEVVYVDDAADLPGAIDAYWERKDNQA